MIKQLELLDFRNYEHAVFKLDTGVTAVLGRNGQGKTNVVEALGYLATLGSFRGVANDALIRTGAETAIIRADAVGADRREYLIEAELNRSGRNRIQVNRQRTNRSRDLLGVIRVTVFAPDDLVLIKGGPGERRRFCDDALVATSVRFDAVRLELDRILKQRNRLLKQVGGRSSRSGLDADAATTLDVWDAKFADVGEQLGAGRADLVAQLQPLVATAYAELADQEVPIDMVYDPPWRRDGLATAVAAARSDDLQRVVTTVGPHRDDVELSIGGLPARSHASQGEQRTLALALRLATHRLVAEIVGTPPILILDDVLSELDPGRATALLTHVPEGQVIITSASPLPAAARPDHVIKIDRGTVIDDDVHRDDQMRQR